MMTRQRHRASLLPLPRWEAPVPPSLEVKRTGSGRLGLLTDHVVRQCMPAACVPPFLPGRMESRPWPSAKVP